jgi:hypothetical protein
MRHVLHTKLSRLGKDGLAFLMGERRRIMIDPNYDFRFSFLFDVI